MISYTSFRDLLIKNTTQEWVNSPLSLSHSNESSWKITWNPWYSHEKSGQIIMFHRNLAAILGWLPVTMMPMTENSEVENSDHLRSKTPFCHHLRPLEPPSLLMRTSWCRWRLRLTQLPGDFGMTSRGVCEKPKKNCGWRKYKIRW